MRSCIFDLDGTLINTLPTVHYYCNRSLQHFGLRSISEPECQNLCRLPISSFYRELLSLGGCPKKQIEELAVSIQNYDIAEYLKNFLYLSQPYAGIQDMLQGLLEKNVVTAVLTNKPADIATSLIAEMFPRCFKTVRGQTMETISKPDPRSLWNLLDDLGLEQEECVYVGDSDVDMDTGIAAGVTTVGVTWGFQSLQVISSRSPDYIVNHPKDLLSLF